MMIDEKINALSDVLSSVQQDELIELYKKFKSDINMTEDALEKYPYSSDLMRELRILCGIILEEAWSVLKNYDVSVLITLYKMRYFAPFQVNVRLDGPHCKDLFLGEEYDNFISALYSA